MDNKTIELLTGMNLKEMFTGGYNLLVKNKAFIDNLNVFPVPDGDTGVNMSMTMKYVIKEIENIAPSNIAELAKGITLGALKGACGNSGNITSLILKGMMSVLSNGNITVKTFAAAMAKGSKAAYLAVRVPKEGTILTVIRIMSEKAVKLAETDSDFIQFLTKVINAGEDILAKTPDMLPVLKEAGVVDVGGRGLITIFRGFLAVLKGESDTVELNLSNDIKKTAAIEDTGGIEFMYCAEFFVVNIKKTATMACIDIFRNKLAALGGSIICAGDLNMLKVHIHTNTPDKVLKLGLALGKTANVKIENMLEQKGGL